MDEAVRARTSAKCWLTRTANRLREVIDSNETLSKTELTVLIDQLMNRLQVFDDAQCKVEGQITNSDELECDIDAAADYRDNIMATLIKGRETLDKLDIPIPVENDASTSSNFGSDARVNARLPRIELVCFSGDVTQWKTFWDQYCAIIHESNQPDVSKFTYLRSLLKDEALRCIDGLSLTSANYKSALSILQQRFGRSECIIFGHIQKLLSLASKSSGKTDLWSLYDMIQTHVRSLNNLGIDGMQYGVILTPIILHQLPNNIRLEWAREGEGHEGDLDFLLEFLFNEIRRRERSQTFATSTIEPADEMEHRRHFEKPKRATAAALFAGQSSNNKCVCCDGEHYIDQCSQVKELSFDDRKNMIKRKGLCFVCLGNNHLSRDCKKSCFSCKGKHHLILCYKYVNRNAERSAPSAKHDIPQVGITYSNSRGKRTLMQVVKTKIDGKRVNVMFDSGADRSFITSACATKLNLNVMGKEKVTFSCFAENKPVKQKEQKKIYRLNASGKSISLVEIPTICCDMYRCAVPGVVLNEFANIPFEENFWEDDMIAIDILIGLDMYWELIAGNEHVKSKGLMAQKTVFGWMLSGQYSYEGNVMKGTECPTETERIHSLFCHCEISEDAVRRLWDLESFGVTDSGIDNSDSDQVLTKFKANVTFEIDRYRVKLPWKNDELKERLMNNEEEAKKRLIGLLKKLDRDIELKMKYNAVLSDLEKAGIIHEVPECEIEKEGPIFYLPHRPVIREESLTTKIRPVFDASAKGKNGLSLNDCMETGPNLIPDIIQVLLRFRRWKFGLSADITKAFLQIKLDEKDQEVHRFLWQVDNQIRIMRFERVTFGNASSPFLLNATLKHHLTFFEQTRTVLELNENLYVDDLLTGADSEEEIMNMMTEAQDIMMKGGFPLAKWTSNCPKMNLMTDKTMDEHVEIPYRKILGVQWNTATDRFCFETAYTQDDLPTTKRKLLSLIARTFDPLGSLTPFTIKLKILFQDVWKMGLDWDQTFSSEIQDLIRTWIDGLKEIRNWAIPRCMATTNWNEADTVKIIAFSDSSEKAFGCCLYLQMGQQRNPSLIMSKVRVAPLKAITLPRLELMAAVLMARLITFVTTSLKLKERMNYTCYTDSQIVLHWIKNEPHRWKQFVCNRVQEIQEHTNPANWRHCPGKENPADLLTRGISAKELTNSDLWIHGPTWLRESNTTSLELHLDFEDGETFTNEMLEMEKRKTETVLTSATTKRSSLIDYNKFSDFGKIVRIVAWIKRFVQNCKPGEKTLNKTLSSQEVENGRITTLQCIQAEHYGDELNDLRDKKIVKKSSSINKLSPFMGQNDLMRVRGRLDFAPALLYDEKHPIILPKSHVSYLIVKSQHLLMKHVGVGALISTLRNNYWIVSVRTLAKQICKQCIRCQRQDSRSCDQVTAPLPEDRVKRSPPFSVIGVDHAGPLFCRDTPDKKRYILLFTCAIVRAIHIELVDSLSLDDFVLAFRRFSSRRGRPSIVYSDNAKTFRGAYSLLQKEMGHFTIVWKFSAPLSPWWGGWWERLIRSIKSALRKSLGLNLITRTELETILHEIEACVNSRPLTYVEETGIPLSPSHFLIGRSSPMNSTDVVEFCTEMNDLRLREKCQSSILERFWETWEESYIRNLPPIRVQKENTDIKIGTMVLIRDDNKPRLKWPLGVVTKTFPGKDGFIRAVELKTSKGFLTRAIQRLHKLEMFDLEEQTRTPSVDTVDVPVTVSTVEMERNQKLAYTTRSGRKVKATVMPDYDYNV